MKRRYAGLLQADKRYPAGGEITLDGGYKALEYNGIPLTADKGAGTAENPGLLEGIYWVSLDNLEFLELEPYQWMDKDGAVLFARRERGRLRGDGLLLRPARR